MFYLAQSEYKLNRLKVQGKKNKEHDTNKTLLNTNEL